MKKVLLLSAVILLLLSNILAQAPDTLWTKTFRGSNYDSFGNAVQQTSDEGYVIVGSSGEFFYPHVYLIKTDSLGDTLWTKTFGETGYQMGYSVQQTSEGGFIVAGSTNYFEACGEEAYLIKTDSLGDTLWTKTYGGVNAECGRSVQQTSDGGYIVAGSSGALLFADVYLIKTDLSGNTLWTKTITRLRYNEGNSVQQTSDGGYIIAGTTSSIGAESYDIYLIKTDSSGDTLWTNTYGGSSTWDEGNFVQQTSDGGYIITGGIGDDVCLIKTDSSGNMLWIKTFGGIGSNDDGKSVQQTSDGGYIVQGARRSSDGSDEHVYLIKTDSSGDTLWTKTIRGISPGVGRAVQQTSDGGYILTGYIRLFDDERDELVYYVCLVKLAPESPSDVRSHYNQIPSNYSLCQNFPNPFNPSTTIKYQIPLDVKQETKNVKLIVYDLLGREVTILVNDNQKPGNYEITWNASAYPSGVYFYQLKAGEFTETKKLILMK